MELILWRHADAEEGERDLERKLTGKGRKQATRVARWLQHRLPFRTAAPFFPDRLLTVNRMRAAFQYSVSVSSAAAASGLSSSQACGRSSAEPASAAATRGSADGA